MKIPISKFNLLLSSNSRTSIVKKNVLGSFVVKGISILISLVLVPLTIGYVSNELYGIWLTLSTIVYWTTLFDFGFGNGLRNKVTECIALKDWTRARQYISTAYFYFIVVFIPISIVLWFICGEVNWAYLLSVENSYQHLMVAVIRIVLVFFSVTMIAKIINTVLAALQMNAVANMIDMLGQLLVLIMTYVLTFTTEASLLLLAIVISVCPLLVYVIYSIWFYTRKYKNLSPTYKLIKKSMIKDVLNLGLKFFVMQLSVIIMYQTMNIIISHVSGPESVTEFNVVYKYLSLPLLAVTIIIQPLWSACTDAYTLKDYVWMQNIYKKIKILFAIVLVVMLLLIILYPLFFKIWIGDKVDIHVSMVLSCALYMTIIIWNSIHSALINGFGKITLMLYGALLSMIIDIPLAYVLGLCYGAQGVVLAVTILMLPGIIINPIQVNKIISNTARGIWNK